MCMAYAICINHADNKVVSATITMLRLNSTCIVVVRNTPIEHKAKLQACTNVTIAELILNCKSICIVMIEVLE